MAIQVYNFTPEYWIIGSNEFEAFRNGLKQIVGQNYEELTLNTARFIDPLVPGDLIEGQVRGRQVGGHPGLYQYEIITVAAPTGQLFTVPIYTVGNDSMRVWRNGKLLSLANGDYTEVISSAVRVNGPQSVGDQFEFIIRGENPDGAPILFEEISAIGGVNETFTLAGSFILGSDTLEVYRNGKKLVINYGFDELSATEIRFNGTSMAGDTFTFLVRAETDSYLFNQGFCS